MNHDDYDDATHWKIAPLMLVLLVAVGLWLWLFIIGGVWLAVRTFS
jgi:hypothetical protein